MNQLQVIGNLTKDALIKKVKSGEEYLFCTVAVNESKDSTMYVNVRQKKYGDKEPGILKYMLKGKKVFVQGRMSASAYFSQQDNQYKVDITLWADNIELCGGNDSQQGGQQPEPTAEKLFEARGAIYPDKTNRDEFTPLASAAAAADQGDGDLPF